MELGERFRGAHGAGKRRLRAMGSPGQWGAPGARTEPGGSLKDAPRAAWGPRGARGTLKSAASSCCR